MDLSDDVLTKLEKISDRGDPPPWQSWIEGRDGLSGDSFIIVGDAERHDRREDIYIDRDSGPADAATLDLVAAARTYLPVLIEEVRRLRAQLSTAAGGQ